MHDVKTYAVALGILAVAFLGRVLGQWVVSRFGVDFLPPIAEWDSGLLPYPLLLSAQIVILILQFEVSRQLWRGAGLLAARRPRLGQGLKWLSIVYFLGMVARYIITMSLFPERRWFGGSIPIVFHWGLAAYLYVLSRYHRGLPLRQRSPE